MTAIEVRELRKTFRVPEVPRTTVREHVFDLFRPRPTRALEVLAGVSFGIAAGETVGLVGRNGSGKSTLLKLVAGIYQPDGGSVHVAGGLTPVLELGVGWNPDLDAVDNVHLIGAVMGLGLAEIRASVDDILAFAEVEAFRGLPLRHYSSGMAARLAYAVAFRAVRDILVLDEIFAVGDAGFRARCQDRYRELRAAGATVLLVSHDPATVTTFCDRALLLDRGRIVFDGEPEEACRRYTLLARAQPAGLHESHLAPSRRAH
jgi:ABC-type polysaccharide/polyol phosphate transport system ATPase subunit